MSPDRGLCILLLVAVSQYALDRRADDEHGQYQRRRRSGAVDMWTSARCFGWSEDVVNNIK